MNNVLTYWHWCQTQMTHSGKQQRTFTIWSIKQMSLHQRSNLPENINQVKAFATSNKRVMFYLITSVTMLFGALLLSKLT